MLPDAGPDAEVAAGEVVEACNLCGSGRWELRFAASAATAEAGESWHAFRCTHSGFGVHGEIVRCRDCGLVYARERLPAGEIEARYEEVEDPLYDRERDARKLTFRRHLAAIEKLTGPAAGRRLLDVGCHIGVFVEAAAAAGWDARGIDPSAWAVDLARQRGLPVDQGVLERGRYPSASFDVITLWDVIEHLADPLDTLRCCRELLRPGGWIVVHTMDVGSVTARLLGSRWPWLMEMHLYYFDRRTLPAMLEAAGLTPVRTRGQGRYLRLRYLASRLEALAPRLGRPASMLLSRTPLGGIAVPVSFGDLFTYWARR